MTAAGDVIRRALAQLPPKQLQADALNELRILEARLQADQLEIERLREAQNTGDSPK